MKRFFNIRNYFTLLSVLIMAGGCGNFLSENPDNRVELNSTTKAAELLTNAYSSAGYTFTEWMGNTVSYTTGTTKLQSQNQSYNWQDVTSDAQDTPINFWTSTYDAIAHSNEVLAIIDNLDDTQARRDAVKGEALLTRAYGHLMLVNLFAKQYNPQTASTDLGIPYVSTPETVFIKKYKRNTIQETYDKIEADILEGLNLVNDSYYANSGKYHFTKNAALALASRFYLFKTDFANCVKYSSQLLDTDPDGFIKDIPTLLAQKVNGDDYIRLYHAPGDKSNLLLVRQVTNFHITMLGYWPSKTLYPAIFENNPFGLVDEREDPAWVAGTNGLAAARYEPLFERSSLTSNVGLNYTIALGFRGEEVLLNRAECYVYQNQINSAIADLQRLVSKRYRGDATLSVNLLQYYYGTANSQEAVLQFILDERLKEFIQEGLHWFDIKRYQIPVQHVLENGSVITLTANDNRKILQIPQTAIDVGGLEPNPR